MSLRHLLRVESVVPRRAERYGGKAKNLAALARAGFPVPAAYAMSGEVCLELFQAVLAPEEQIEALLRRRDVREPELARIADKVRRAPLPTDLMESIRGARRDLLAAGATTLVVRSSSTREDEEEASAAGLHHTFLDVRTESALEDAVRECFASLYQARVLGYLRNVAHGESAAMGIVIQAMVPADVSGVVFTVNPLTADASEIVVNASWGLGPSLVEGRVSPDTYRVDKMSLTLRDRAIGDKAVRTVILESGGVGEEEVPLELRTKPVLSDGLLSDLAAIARRAEDQFGGPQDLEFAIADSTLYVLQCRPVTSLPPSLRSQKSARRGADRARIVWSNVNVGEALPGVATPLTWSILSGFSELGFRRAFGALGCHVPRDAELVGSFRGRIYLNMSEFVSIASQVPGLHPRTLLALGGGGGADALAAQTEDRSSAGFFVRLPVTVTRFVRENYRLAERVEELEAVFQEERGRYRAMDLRVLSPLALGKTLRDVESLLDSCGAVMLSCYGNLLLSVVVLRGVLAAVVHRNAERVERALLTGLADVESAAPGLALWHIAGMARAEPAARELLLTDPSTLRLASFPDGATRRALERFLEAYGHRGPREAEIATPRWREDPTLIFAALRAQLAREGAGESPVDVEARQRAVRDAASREVERMLPGPAKAAVRHLLSLVQRFMRLRERLRGEVTEVLGMFREVALDASRRLHARDPGIGSDAAFYLTLEELHSVLAGDARSLAVTVKQRRRQHERDVRLPDPPDTFVGQPPEALATLPDTRSLSGLAASSGRVEGLARVLSSPERAGELEAGEILVVPYADVGWSPLFTVAAAVVTDLGGPLSHASIVAREYGVPSVVNLKVGTRMIRTGDRILVDGDAGTVTILSQAHAAA